MSLYKLQIKNSEKSDVFLVTLFKRERRFFRGNWKNQMIFEGNESEVIDFILLLSKMHHTIIHIENKSTIDQVGNNSVKTLYSSL